MTDPSFRTFLILGGARSGKTRHALHLCETLYSDCGLRPIMVATAESTDPEMEARITRHRAERGPHWQTVEEPLDLPAAIRARRTKGTVVAVDCLTVWLANLMHHARDIEATIADLEDAIAGTDGTGGPLLLVSNEVGLSIVPENALARRFRDEAGFMNQRMARIADRVDFIAAGLPMRLKG